MNLVEKYNENELKLLENAIGIGIENRDYSDQEIDVYKNRIADYIMSQSSKNGAIDTMMRKYNKINWCTYSVHRFRQYRIILRNLR